jgi:hypothetical protein
MKKVSIVVDVQHTYIKSQKKWVWSRNIEKFYKGMTGLPVNSDLDRSII